MRSVHGEPVFAAVSTLTPSKQEKTILPNTQGHSDSDSSPADVFPSEDSDVASAFKMSSSFKLTTANQSSNNNNASNNENIQIGPLDELTADSISCPPSQLQPPLQRKKSAAEKLGLKRKTSKPLTPRDIPRCRNNSLFVDAGLSSVPELSGLISNIQHQPKIIDPITPLHETKVENNQETNNEYSKVVSCNKGKSRSPREAFVQNRKENSFPPSISVLNSLVSPSEPKRKTSLSTRIVAKKDEGSLSARQERCQRDATIEALRNFYWNKVGSRHTSLSENFSPRLDSFNPEGKKREGYERLDLVAGKNQLHKVEVQHSRSCDSSSYSISNDSQYSSFHAASQLLSLGNKRNADLDVDFSAGAGTPTDDDVFQTLPAAQPKPAPRKHVRSFSAGDCLDQKTDVFKAEKPKPFPRLLHQRTPRVQNEFDSDMISGCKQNQSQNNCDDISYGPRASNEQIIGAITEAEDSNFEDSLQTTSITQSEHFNSLTTFHNSPYEHLSYYEEPIIG